MKPASASRIPALDGIRGAALLVVFVHHFAAFNPSESGAQRALAAVADIGWCGVDLFFALSGFLITGILLRSEGEPDYYSRFYWRRARRIFPIYYLYVGLQVLLVVAGHRLGLFRHTGTEGQWWLWAYLANWHDSGLPGTAHLWSLCVEEQFYLAWPLLLVIFRRRRLSFCLCVAGASFLARIAAQASGINPVSIYQITPFRLDDLALGSAAACVFAHGTGTFRRFLPWLVFGGISAALCAAIFGGTKPIAIGMQMAGFGAFAVASAALVLWCAVAAPQSRIARLFSLPPLRNVGKYSYGMYVIHYSFVLSRGPMWQAPLRLIAGTAISYGIARLSWRWIEGPMLKPDAGDVRNESHSASTKAEAAVL